MNRFSCTKLATNLQDRNAQMVEWQTLRSERPAPTRVCEFDSRSAHQNARLVELADTPVSGTGAREGMRVRVPRRVPIMCR